MTRQQLIKKVQKEIIIENLKFSSVKKLKSSSYFIESVKRCIGKIAFMNDYALTVADETKLVNEVFEVQ
jgi:hypothetical protein